MGVLQAAAAPEERLMADSAAAADRSQRTWKIRKNKKETERIAMGWKRILPPSDPFCFLIRNFMIQGDWILYVFFRGF